MKKWKKLTAMGLAAVMLFTGSYQPVLADTVTSEDVQNVSELSSEETLDEVEQTEPNLALEDTQSTGEWDEVSDTEEDTKDWNAQSQEEKEPEESEEPQNFDELQDMEEPQDCEESEETEDILQYLIIENPYVEAGGEQLVYAGIGDGSHALKNARLVYVNEDTKESYTTEAVGVLDDFAAFQMEFLESSCGKYRLVELEYEMDGTTRTIDLKQYEMDGTFGVGTRVSTEPDDIILSEEEIAQLAEATDMNVVPMDGTSDAIEQMEETLEKVGGTPQQAQEFSMGDMMGAVKGANNLKNFTVVLDPGHGGYDSGAVGNGVTEKIVNLKIALYCKAALEQYSNVKVYLTRSDDTYLDLAQRAQIAHDKNANVFVSLHNNSNVSAAPCGANVYYPNGNYRGDIGQTGAALASVVLSKLTALGLASGGTHIRNSENGTLYPDGSLADYYGVIKRCKEFGIPAIIVEHAFLSNASDANTYLKSEASLKKLGEADAQAIAQYFGFAKGVTFTYVYSDNEKSMKLGWKAYPGASGYEICRATSQNGTYKVVKTITKGSTTSWKNTGLVPGTEYYYKIRSYSYSNGNKVYGVYSSPVAGVTVEKSVIKAVESLNSTKLRISFSSASDLIEYHIQRATSKSGTYKTIAKVAGRGILAITDKDRQPGKNYYYRVYGVAISGKNKVIWPYSDVYVARTAVTPSKVKVVSKDSNTLEISWQKDKKNAGYRIYRATSKSGKYTKVAGVSGSSKTSYLDKTVKTGQEYYYKVVATNKNGNAKGVSNESGVVRGKTVAKTKILTIGTVSTTQLKLTWNKVNGANGYVIYRSTSSDKGYKSVKVIESSKTTSYTDSKLTPGTRYYYKIVTRNSVDGRTGYGSACKVRSGYVAKAPEVKAAAASAAKITVSWNKVSNATGYKLYYKAYGDKDYKLVKTVKQDVRSVTVSNLCMKKKYYFKVEALIQGYQTVGTTKKSAAASAYTTSKTEISSISRNEEGNIVLKWKKVGGIAKYEIYRSQTLDGEYNCIATISKASTTSYVDETTEGIKYYYKILIKQTYNNKTIVGNYSKVVCINEVGIPQDVSVTAISGTQLKITFSQVSDAVQYEIYRCETMDGEYVCIGTSTENSYLDETVTEGKTYYYKIKAVDAKSNKSEFSSVASGYAVAKLRITSASYDKSKNKVNLKWTTPSKSAVKCNIWKISSDQVNNETILANVTALSYSDSNVSSGKTYYYRISYTDKKGNIVYSDTVSTNKNAYRIMGSSNVTASQLQSMYQKSGRTYPSTVYKNKGAKDLKTFCNIVVQECIREGVKPEVIFAQICLETNYLQFGGQVKADQCNFGGLGATDDGASGGVFPDVRTGIRAQVQHMKAYASTNPLVTTCVDNRFKYVKRGKAEYVEQLGCGNWATDTAYASKLLNNINKIKAK